MWVMTGSAGRADSNYVPIMIEETSVREDVVPVMAIVAKFI